MRNSLKKLISIGTKSDSLVSIRILEWKDRRDFEEEDRYWGTIFEHSQTIDDSVESCHNESTCMDSSFPVSLSSEGYGGVDVLAVGIGDQMKVFIRAFANLLTAYCSKPSHVSENVST